MSELIFSGIQFGALCTLSCVYVCVYNFSFYEKVEPFPRIMTLDMVGPMVTLLCFKATLCFKWKVIFGIENFKYAN